MLDQLMQIVRQHSQQSIVENQDVPNEHNEGVIQEAGSSLFSSLQQMIQNGKLEQVTDLIKGNHSSDTVNQLSEGMAGNIASKFGINAASAKNIAGSLLPKILNSLSNGTSNKSLDLQSMLGSLTSGGGIQSTINTLGSQFGLDKDKDGDVDFKDITRLFGQ